MEELTTKHITIGGINPPIVYAKKTRIHNENEGIVPHSAKATKKQIGEKSSRKKLVSQTEQWINTAKTYSTPELQLLLLADLMSSNKPESESANILWMHLKTKHFGYKSQDTIKKIYEPDKFVQISDIIRLLIESNLSCFYCKKWTTLFYDKVRDSRQWSLERISNTEGHNCNNVVIACLECNMRRRTMYHERYIATKQLKVNKLDGDDDENDEMIAEQEGVNNLI